MNDRLFTRYDLSTLLREKREELVQEIHALDKNKLLHVSELDLCEHFESRYLIDPPMLRRGEMAVCEPREIDVDVSQGPGRDIRDRTRPFYVKGVRIIIVVPLDGDADLFFYLPSVHDLSPPCGSIVRNELRLTYDTARYDREELQRAYSGELNSIERYLQWVQEDVQQYNKSLSGLIRETIRHRKNRLLQGEELVTSLNIPIRRRTAESIAVVLPRKRRKHPVKLPKVPIAVPPEYYLAEEEYDYILKVIEDMVLVMERSPAAFARMGEETLRDFLLVPLNGHYEGSATGETFNFNGRTDILIRHEGKNVFIAECKLWDGPKKVLDGVDQLFGYASWRDTKMALIIFNRDRDHTSVLQKIAEAIPTHRCCRRNLGNRDETHFRYLFHHPGDITREAIVSVLVFCVPRAGTE